MPCRRCRDFRAPSRLSALVPLRTAAQLEISMYSEGSASECSGGGYYTCPCAPACGDAHSEVTYRMAGFFYCIDCRLCYLDSITIWIYRCVGTGQPRSKRRK